MRIGILIKLSLRSVMRNRMRSLLTTLGIIIGVSSVIVMVAVGEGSQASIRENIASMGANLIMVNPLRGPGSVNRLTAADVEKIRNEASYLSAVSGVVRRSTTVVGGSGSWSTTIFGVEPDYPLIKEWKIATGDFFSEKDVDSRKKIAVVGTTVARELFGQEDPLGRRLRVDTTPFQIVGVLEGKGNNAMGNDQDDVVMVPLSTATARLQKSRFLGGIEMSALSEDLMNAAQEEVESIMRESHRLADGAENDFMVFNQSQIIEIASSTAKTLTVLLGAIAGVSLIVGGIGIMNIMLVSVTERTREIGIRLSVGARRRDILRQFMTEAVVLSLIGGVIGILLALVAIYVLSKIMDLRVVVNPLFIFISAGFAAAVGVFFGYYPAHKGASMNPIDALRSE